MCCYVIAIFIACFMLYKYYEYHRGKRNIDNITNRYVFITGCDTGFGNAFAKNLDKLGVPVFAACLTEKGCAALKKECSSRLLTLQMDVTKDDSIADAVMFVRKTLPKGRELWGLVNNAGLQVLDAPLEFQSRSAIEKCLSVNLYGTIFVTKAFLPLIRKSQGRIVHISSACALVYAPSRVPYVISKVGVEALAGCLRKELYYAGVTSHTIQPGSFKTAIVDPNDMVESLQHAFDSTDDEVKDFYGQNWLQGRKAEYMGIPATQYLDLSEVVNAVQHALFSVLPKTAYRYRCRTENYITSFLGDKFNSWYYAMIPQDAVSNAK